MAISKKRADGKYRARYRDPDGRERAKHFDRRVDAERWLTEQNHKMNLGTYIDPDKGRTTVAAYFAEWSARQPWRPSSRKAIEITFATHVLPRYGNRPLGSIRRGDLEAWAAGLSLSARSSGTALKRFSTMLDAAVGDGLLASNPARAAKRPRVEESPVVPFTLEEIDRLRDASPVWFGVAFTLGALCGLRQAEACGLTVDRLNMLGRTLRVDRQLLTPANGEPALGPPKTARSFRTVPLADVAVDELAAHLAAFGPGRDGLVLHRDREPMRSQTFGRVWRAIRETAGLPKARFHDLRHGYASTLLSGGVSVAAAAEYLGHHPAMLLTTYAHLLPADHDRARMVVQTAFADSARTSGSRRAL